MKAAILRELNAPLSVERIKRFALADGQVLVRVMASSICGAQLGEIAGAKGEDKYLPHLLGHEGGGIVQEVGPGVRKVSPGDHVVLHWRKGKGIDAPPPKYLDEQDKLVGGGWVTTFNTHAVVSENRVTKIHEDVPFKFAALMGCAVTTGLGIINHEAQIKFGQSIMVIGAGGVGLFVLQGAYLAGAARIMAVDSSRDKLRFLSNIFPWIECYDAFPPDGKFDVVVDCTGNSNCIRRGFELTKSGGRMVLVGQPRAEEEVTFQNMRQHYIGKILMDSQGGLTDPDVDIERYIALYECWRLNLSQMITHTFRLDEINTALDMARSGCAGKIIIDMEEEE